MFVRDLGKEYGGWPLNDMERSYKFTIRHVWLWKVAFHGTSPRWVHGMYLAALAYFYAKYELHHTRLLGVNSTATMRYQIALLVVVDLFGLQELTRLSCLINTNV